MACFCCRRINTTTSLVVLFHLPRAERFVRHALLAEPAFLDLRRGCSFYPSLGNSEEMVNSTFPLRHALLAEPAFLDLHWRKEMVNSTFPRPIGIDSSLCLLSQHTWRRILPRPIGIDSPLCLLSQHTWRRILPRRCHLDRRRGGCCPATATGANPHHVRRRPERLNCCRPSPFSVACPVLPFVSETTVFFSRFEIRGLFVQVES